MVRSLGRTVRAAGRREAHRKEKAVGGEKRKGGEKSGSEKRRVRNRLGLLLLPLPLILFTIYLVLSFNDYKIKSSLLLIIFYQPTL